MKMRYLPLALSALLLAGCGPKRIDGSSEEAFKKSLESMSKGLSESDQEELSKDVMALAMSGSNIFELGANPDAMQLRLRNRLDGKTFEEIRTVVREMEAQEAAERLQQEKKEAAEKAARMAERKAQIESEIAELEKEKAKADADTAALAKFTVSRSRFYFSDTGYTTKPIIELTVNNGLPSAVSRVYFKAVLASPGRSVPWVDDSFNYSVRGGIEPGEEATWSLAPNMFSEWGKAPKDRNDMVLTVTLVKVDGPDGNALYDSEFRESKADRLAKLKDMLAKGDLNEWP